MKHLIKSIARIIVTMHVLVLLATSTLLCPFGQAANKDTEKRLEGKWTGISISRTPPGTAEQAKSDAEQVRSNILTLLPNHKFSALFSVPFSGKWSIKGSTIILKFDAIGDNPVRKSTKQAKSSTVSFQPDSVTLTLSKDGQTLSKPLDNGTMLFKKTSSPH